jgi:hypothetical protein
MASPASSRTRSSARVFKVRNYRISNPKLMFFRGHRWEFTVWCTCDGDVVFSVEATPQNCLRKYAQTISKAKISIEILDESRKPIVFREPRIKREIKSISYTRQPFFGVGPPGRIAF